MKKYKFKLIAGKHSQGEHLYDANDQTNNTISTTKELDVLFGNSKFQRIEASEVEEERVESAEGELTDVTDQFKKAQQANLQVLHDSEDGYSIVDPEEGEAAVNEEELTTKKQVNAFISNYVN